MTRLIGFSLPGICDDASTTVSPWPIRTLWSLLAIRDSAAIGSPCDPVHISTTWSSGRSSILRASTRMSGGTVR